MTDGGVRKSGLRIKMDPALNTAFSDWGKILYNTTIATAIADRMIENSHVFLLGGPSIRNPKNKSQSQEPVE